MPGKNSATRSPSLATGPLKSSSAPTMPSVDVLPRRWVVERTLTWLNRNRRLVKDFEASVASAKAWLIIASVQLLIRRVVYSGCNHPDS
jgi:transposase